MFRLFVDRPFHFGGRTHHTHCHYHMKIGPVYYLLDGDHVEVVYRFGVRYHHYTDYNHHTVAHYYGYAGSDVHLDAHYSPVGYHIQQNPADDYAQLDVEVLAEAVDEVNWHYLPVGIDYVDCFVAHSHFFGSSRIYRSEHAAWIVFVYNW